ncbi:MAG: YqgE/AlgH family protein [Saprospiraceae bacterium]
MRVKAGKILVAEPFMRDSPFKRTVILMTEHRPDGSVGFILNRKIGMKVNDLLAEFPEFDAPVYYGGPVDTDTMHYIHNVGDLLENSNEIVKGVYWGGDFDKLKFLVSNGLVQPQNIKFFIGYSGWSEGQLQGEINEGTWIVEEMFANYAFKAKISKLWSLVLKNKGDAYGVIAQMPESPCNN